LNELIDWENENAPKDKFTDIEQQPTRDSLSSPQKK